MEKIELKLKRLRYEKGYTQEEIAMKLGISQATYSILESGQSKLDVEMMYKIVKVYGLDFKEFLS
ncbi:helix-turn-helix domain-containing protein [Runella zeae]|uniref:helix-turn-helix domain-containing protein n=1 Tax=Runella zeae TaxID=94255 RepID=UPI002353E82F|nr:helix-turn-helix transcriptional regulator [Runella zeae]